MEKIYSILQMGVVAIMFRFLRKFQLGETDLKVALFGEVYDLKSYGEVKKNKEGEAFVILETTFNKFKDMEIQENLRMVVL